MLKTLIYKYLNLHIALAIIIVLVACTGLGLVLLSEAAYQKQAIQQQKNALQNLLSIKSNDLLSELIYHHKELGYVLQTEDSFIKAFTDQDEEQLRYWLDQEFNRYYATTGLIKLEKLLVYDTSFGLISRSARGVAMAKNGTPPCVSLIKNMSQLPLIEHLKPRTELCLYDNKPLLSTIVSIGSLHPRGYIQIASDPAYILANLEDRLGIDIQITAYDGTIFHQSSNWPALTTDRQILVSSHITPSSNGNPLLVTRAASKAQDFHHDLASTTQKIIASSTLAIIVVIFIALIALRKTLLPLKSLQSAASDASKGNYTTVKETSFREITMPLQLFNNAARRIDALTDDLENEISTHNNTEEKLWLAIEQAEDNALKAETQRNFLRMTLKSVIDGVITTDTSGHITYINPIAEQLTGWTEEDAHDKPLVQVFHAIDTESHERIYDPTENIKNKSVLEEPVSAILIQNNTQIKTPVEFIATPMLDGDDNTMGSVIIIHDESAQRSLNRQLTFQATHDALTGLLNHFEFEKRLKQLLSENNTWSSPYTFCYLDIDNFKKINDEYGHAAGDELLKQVTLLLEKQLDEQHILARVGSDEFGLLLENCDITHAETILNKILQSVDRFNFIWEMSSTGINISIGIASLTADVTSYTELLDNVSSACRLAKEDGRNRLQVYTPENNSLLTQQREMHWVSRINHALEEDRFQLYYHEIMPLQQKSQQFIRHGEALLRMIDKKGEVVSPNMFLPAAERYGMLGVIDKWVVDKAISWLREESNNAIISINISGGSITSTEFLNFVVSCIKQTKINPEFLCFEITESVAIQHLSDSIHFMTVLKKLGCRFALDDFGSGLSSFSYLTSLPVDYLKIDGTFVVDIDKDPMHYAMVKSINEVGHVMGIETIAEYAASSQIIDCLREIGIDKAQGYAIARPKPLASYDSNEESISKLSVIETKPRP